MTLFQFSAVFLTLVALVGWLNARALKLPTAVGMLGAGVLGAGGLYGLQRAIPPFWGFNDVRRVIGGLDFSDAVLGYLLAFLIFAGGMQVDLKELRRRLWPVFTLATLGVVASTALVGFGLSWAAAGLHVDIPLPWAFVFAALISPTDPVAVIQVARSSGLSRRLTAVLQGEALFNDGVGVVAFTAALAVATSGAKFDAPHAIGAVVLEAGGGLLLGAAGGWLVVQLMRAIDDHVVETTASLALAAGGYALASALHLSGPVAAAAAGVVVGSYGVEHAMSDRTQAYIQAFWALVDEILNASLFLLLGLQMFVIRLDLGHAGVWLACAGLVTVARLLVVLPWGVWFHFRDEERAPSLVLAWGGLRGAISVALALSIPHGEPRDRIVAATFVVVSLSIVFQGLTFGPLVRALRRPGTAGDDAPPPTGLDDAGERRVLDDAPLAPLAGGG